VEIGLLQTRHIEEQSFAERVSETHHRVIAHVGRKAVNVAVLVASDLMALSLALLIACLIRFELVPGFVEPRVLTAMWALLPLYVVGAATRGLYPGWGLGSVEELRRSVLVLAGYFGVITGVLFLTQQGPDVSRLILVGAFTLSMVTVPLLRTEAKRMLINAGHWGVPTVIYGAGKAGRRIVEILREDECLGYVPAAIFDDDFDKWGERIQGVEVLGGLELATAKAPVAILAIPSLGRQKTTELLEGPLACYRTVIIVPDLTDAPSLWVRPRDFGGLLSLQISSNLTNLPAQIAKRAADVVAITVSAPIWIPVVLLLGLLVWLEDRQNPIFLQERVGRHGRCFRAWKFRTMVPNAEAVLHRHLSENPNARREWETHFKLADDPRVTRVGTLLRRFSLDELPQLFNVVRAEMSLVGPRPLPRYHHEELPDRVRELRERVRPGLTGLWQVSGRSDIGTAGMERWDPYYVRNWSPWLDIVILARTFRAVTSAEGAY
jgi:Undecaprenyl-phosphate galactose phosphotransferase WbaP